MKKIKVVCVYLILFICMLVLTGCDLESFNGVDNSLINNSVKNVVVDYDIKNKVEQISNIKTEAESTNQIEEPLKIQGEEKETSKPKVEEEKKNEVKETSKSKVEEEKSENLTFESKKENTEESIKTNSNLVWIPKTDKKYHNNSGCSNMKNPSQVTKSVAESSGYTPCKKCY